MSDELIERLRQYNYRRPPTRIAQSARHWEDIYAAVDAYLAERPADDDEHVTEKWLLSIGFHLRESQLGPGYMPTLFFGKLGIYLYEGSEWLVENADWISVRTRGDVRRLCKALGVELKCKS